MLTPLTYIRVGDEVIESFKCIDASYELIEAPLLIIPIIIKSLSNFI